MYMGVIPTSRTISKRGGSAPHVYGGDPNHQHYQSVVAVVLPMYMGVILVAWVKHSILLRAPHVYGGDPHQHSSCRQRP